MIKTCQKCGHQNPTATGAQLEACPVCNAIYSRVEAAISEGKLTAFVQQKIQPAAAANLRQEAKPAKRERNNGQPFIETLRAGSHYPNFRAIIGIFALLGYVVAAICAISAVMAGSSIMLTGGGIVLAAFIVVVSKVSKEAALMLADLSDAAVVIAQDSRGRVND